MENPSRPAFHSSGVEGFDWREVSLKMTNARKRLNAAISPV
jgi:hypothetical protein